MKAKKNLTLYFLKHEKDNNSELKFMDYYYYSKIINNTHYSIFSFHKKL